MNLFFIRHSESFKSKEDRHGGKGLPLTEQGKNDTVELVRFLSVTERLDFKDSFLYCSDLIQVIETARIIEVEANCQFEVSSAVKNISLGILDGLSKKEAMEKYPSIADKLEKWRTGEINIDEFTIPEAETMEDFYKRIFFFVNSVVDKKKNVVVIGTRSVGVALTNIFTNFFPEIIKSEYQRYLFDPSSVSKYSFSDGKTSVAYLNKTDFLNMKPAHPDS
ncbi:MAG: histidine phosphatase family protein [Ignavibacteriae bacterium]|nr:histidine phosphatase family protein [Ignavibacteriota bacterium]